jgi:hypothetical protein
MKGSLVKPWLMTEDNYRNLFVSLTSASALFDTCLSSAFPRLLLIPRIVQCKLQPCNPSLDIIHLFLGLAPLPWPLMNAALPGLSPLRTRTVLLKHDG